MAKRRPRVGDDWHSPVIDALRAIQDGDGERAIALTEVLSDAERRSLLALIEYDAQYRERLRLARSPANQRAFGLLRSFLSDEQCRTLNDSRYFHVRGSAGGIYRMIVRTGVVQRVERHGKRWFWAATFCLHDYAEDAPDQKRIPLADLALQHMLLIAADEPSFLALANLSVSRRQRWDREWLRELRRAQAERGAAVAA